MRLSSRRKSAGSPGCFILELLYIIGGSGPSSAVYSITIADGVAECKAIKKAELSVARDSIGLIQYARNYVYAMGGNGKDGAAACCEKYNIETNSWNTIKDLKKAKRNISACVMSEFYLCHWWIR